jgi:hypothetical protein
VYSSALVVNKKEPGRLRRGDRGGEGSGEGAMHVSVRSDDKVYNCKTATISFNFILITLMICKFLNINKPQ